MRRWFKLVKSGEKLKEGAERYACRDNSVNPGFAARAAGLDGIPIVFSRFVKFTLTTPAAHASHMMPCDRTKGPG